jgi:RNA polymerase sigma-70 factor (ECF subfamily)
MTALSELPTDAPARGRAVEGDAHLHQLYRTHASALNLFLSQFTSGDRAATENLVRETLRRASRSLDPAKADLATVGSWLFTLARRVAIDFCRSQQVASAEGGAPDDGQAPTARGLARHPDADLARALERVSPDDRGIITQLFCRGRSVQETAHLIGVPEASVGSRGYRALRALRSAIQQHA